MISIEETQAFGPCFGPDGLMPVVTTDADSGEVLMLAYMNAEALRATRATWVAHYWSRRRRALWRKGDLSGQVQRVVEVRIDCDQDALWLRVRPGGDGGCCHAGFRSCFYRTLGPLDGEDVLSRNDVPRSAAQEALPTRSGLEPIGERVAAPAAEGVPR